MKLTEDERAFIARWLMEWGDEPVNAETRRASSWWKKTNFLPYLRLYDLDYNDDHEPLYLLNGQVLEAFNKGDSNE